RFSRDWSSDVCSSDLVVVAQLVRVVFVAANAGAQRGDQGTDLGRGQHAVEACAFDVEDLAAQRQHRLVLAVAALLGGTAGGVAQIGRASCRESDEGER